MAELTGLSDAAVASGFAQGDEVTAWLDDGVAPNGAGGRAFTTGSVHGFDLTFAAPKSVSLLRALTTDVNDKVVAEAHIRAVSAAMDYLHQHAGYTRVHNPVTGMKDLQRLPGLVGIAYQHETSRCGDPHLHTHVTGVVEKGASVRRMPTARLGRPGHAFDRYWPASLRALGAAVERL